MTRRKLTCGLFLVIIILIFLLVVLQPLLQVSIVNIFLYIVVYIAFYSFWIFDWCDFWFNLPNNSKCTGYRDIQFSYFLHNHHPPTSSYRGCKRLAPIVNSWLLPGYQNISLVTSYAALADSKFSFRPQLPSALS